MELLQELFVTAVVAVVCSFLIAKLVSIATASSDSTQFSKSTSQNVDHQEIITTPRDYDDQAIMEDLLYFDKLKVEGFKSEKRIRFADELVAEKVDEFVGEREPVVDVEKSVNFDEQIETECRELHPKSTEGSKNVKGEKEAEFEETKQVGVKLVADKSSCSTEEKSEEEVIEEEQQKGDEEINTESIGINFAVENDEVVQESEEIIRIVGSEKEEKEEEKKIIDVESDEDDDWEGIEKSELEQIFAKAAKFVESKDEGLTNVGSDVQMELFGLHKVATEGPCREQPPMAFKVAARAKWY